MIEGLSHITLITRNLDRMTAIVEGALGGREIYSSGDDTFSLSPGPAKNSSMWAGSGLP